MALKTIVENNIEYCINDKGMLKRLRRLPLGGDVVTIPHVLHTGDTINALGESFAAGEIFEEIIISDEITKISRKAFKMSRALSVRWSTGCKRIPRYCFNMSHIRKLTGIDNVTFIGEFAFNCSEIESFVWPSKCQAIPMCCFRKSKLRSISNVEHVVSIAAGAFEEVYLDTPVDFSNALVVETNAFLHADKSMITFPYYHSDC